MSTDTLKGATLVTKELRGLALTVQLIFEEPVSDGISQNLLSAANQLDDMNELMRLLGSIFFYGDFVAETPNERAVEDLLKKYGYRFTSEDEVLAHAPDYKD